MMLRKSLLSFFTLLTVVLAVDPTPQERAVWDKMCQDKVGPNYVMKFNADGKPSGTCEAPPKAACYWGAYKDPKTGADGCCGKDGGTFTTDPNHPKEGGCCVSPQTYTYHASTNRGGCCVPGETYSFDPDANQGSCCSKSFTQFKVDPVTGQKRCCEGDVPRKLYVNSQTGEAVCCAAPLVLSVEASTKKHGCCDQALNFVTDPVSGQGACCAPGKVHSFDSAAGKGGCCNAGQTWTVDTASGKGECCAAGQVYSVDAASGKGGCCASGLAYKVDALTGNGGCCSPDSEYLCDCACRLRPTCPKGHGQIFTSNGKKWKFYCKLINHGDNDLGFSPAPNAAACMDRCAATTNCVRAIFSDTQGLCYLRTHGNKDTPITVDQYDSFHLVEDACQNQGGTPVVPPVDPPTTTDTSTPPPTTAPADDDINSCPNANGKTKVIGGIEYEFFCNKSFSTAMGVDKTTDADNMEDCVKQCSANPRCQGVNFFNEQPDYNCVHAKKHQLAPTGGTFSEGHITAIPVNKR